METVIKNDAMWLRQPMEKWKKWIMMHVGNWFCKQYQVQFYLHKTHTLSDQRMNGKTKNTNPIWINSVLRRDLFTLFLTVFPFFKNSWTKLEKYWETTDPAWSNCWYILGEEGGTASDPPVLLYPSLQSCSQQVRLLTGFQNGEKHFTMPWWLMLLFSSTPLFTDLREKPHLSAPTLEQCSLWNTGHFLS